MLALKVVLLVCLAVHASQAADPSETMEQDTRYVDERHRQEPESQADESDVWDDGSGRGDGLPDFGGLRPIDVSSGVFPVRDVDADDAGEGDQDTS